MQTSSSPASPCLISSHTNTFTFGLLPFQFDAGEFLSEQLHLHLLLKPAPPMAPGSQAGPPVILLLLFFLLHASALEPMEVRVGVAVVLPCSAPLQMDLENLVLEWTREDLRDTYMFFFRDGRPYLQYQDPLFKDRVELQDPDMKNGNLSIVLHDAAILDSGRYECHTFSLSQARKKRSVYNSEPIRTFDLKVLSADVEKIPVMPGEDVVLKMGSLDFPVTSFVWKRADDPEHYVFMYGRDHPHPHHQHPLYQDRIHFENQTQGPVHDMSVVLRRVQPSDSGTYHCIILQSLRRLKRDLHVSEPQKVIVLEVASGVHTFESRVGIVLFLSAALLTLG